MVTVDDTEKTEKMEEVANGSSIATFQSKADVTSRGYKGVEVNVEVQYVGQDDLAELSNNLGRDVKIAEKEEEELVTEELTEEFYESIESTSLRSYVNAR